MRNSSDKPHIRAKCIDWIPMWLAWLTCLFCAGIMLFRTYAPLTFHEARRPQETITLADPRAISYAADGIDPNTADAETLCLLPGVGEKTAQAFINEREINGPFVFPEDLLAVKGIGAKKLNNIFPLIRLN